MNNQPPEFIAGMIVGALIAGGLCGLIPLKAGLSRQRPEWAWGGFILCVMAGLFGGLLVALPAGLIIGGIIRCCVEAPNTRDPGLELWQQWQPAASWDRTPTAPAPAPLAAYPVALPAGGPPGREPAAAAAFASNQPVVQCTGCGNVLCPPSGVLPPWCPKCGSDLKLTSAPTRAAAPQVNTSFQEMQNHRV